VSGWLGRYAGWLEQFRQLVSYMARLLLPCPNCQFRLALNQTTIRGPFRCPSCAVYLRIPYSYIRVIGLISVLLAPTLLMAIGVAWYTFAFILAIIPVMFVTYLVVSFVTYGVAPPKLEIVKSESGAD
jgi:hypothetical protein